MVKENQLSESIDSIAMDTIQQSITTIKSQLPFLLKLSPNQRQGYSRMGDKSLAFVEKALAYAEGNPHLVPPYLKVPEFRKDWELAKSLTKVIQPLQSLIEALDDTLMVAGNESYGAALIFYNSAKRAANNGVQGTQSIVKDLKQRFPGRNSSKAVPKQVDEA
ncbi:hypothetical protein [uncultured Chitinophaga sp.]|jgi:hypothetical protein|uniref:hypothetical protein n=1 Tax=uncultured Chitinophaga sp. TaxID=339340 RepID=UPI00261A94EE|nr:hypothetical protein [uncultured Chitinophaga sp.]